MVHKANLHTTKCKHNSYFHFCWRGCSSEEEEDAGFGGAEAGAVTRPPWMWGSVNYCQIVWKATETGLL